VKMQLAAGEAGMDWSMFLEPRLNIFEGASTNGEQVNSQVPFNRRTSPVKPVAVGHLSVNEGQEKQPGHVNKQRPGN
jgi:hypothetical protein